MRVWQREPERSRRLFRIIYAHWLAAADLPPERRPKLVSNQQRRNESYPEFPYATEPGQRDGAHPLPADKLYNWFRSSLHAMRINVPATFWFQQLDSDRRQMTDLMLTAAERLYVLEHGREPSRNHDLVTAGYLEEIPDGYDDAPVTAEGASEEGRR
jgi:hypothetical protein